MNLKVLTYNVFGMPWGLSSIESILLWSFYKTDAEILCFQEVFSRDHREKLQHLCSHPSSQWNCWIPTVKSTWLSRSTPWFESPSGLCILTKKSIQVVSEPYFEEFKQVSNVDTLIRKGFFHLQCEKDHQRFHVITVHFQSDFTEVQGYRIEHQDIRSQQELQLVQYGKSLTNAVVVGDFNTTRLDHCFFVNDRREPTFHPTGESLDHCVTLRPFSVRSLHTTYFHDLHLSDHIPVLFHLRFLQA